MSRGRSMSVSRGRSRTRSSSTSRSRSSSKSRSRSPKRTIKKRSSSKSRSRSRSPKRTIKKRSSSKSRSRSPKRSIKKRSSKSRSRSPKRSLSKKRSHRKRGGGGNVVSEKTAMKMKVGSPHHPTKMTVLEGNCPEGMIMRDGYYRHSYNKKSGTHIKGKYVKEGCVKNMGKPGKTVKEGKVIPKLKEGTLRKFGYHTDLSEQERLDALVKAVKGLGYAEVIRKVNAVRTLSKANPHLYKIYTTDIENLQKWKAENP